MSRVLFPECLSRGVATRWKESRGVVGNTGAAAEFDLPHPLLSLMECNSAGAATNGEVPLNTFDIFICFLCCEEGAICDDDQLLDVLPAGELSIYKYTWGEYCCISYSLKKT